MNRKDLMKSKIFISLLLVTVLFLCNLGTAQASFYRNNSSDTAFIYGRGWDEQGHEVMGWGYNHSMLANYGYNEDQKNPVLVQISDISTNEATINFNISYISQSQLEYGMGNLSAHSTNTNWQTGKQKIVLKELQCATLYQTRVVTRDVANNKYYSDTKLVQTLSCQTDFGDHQSFDVTNNNGILELTPDLSGQTKLYLLNGHRYTLTLSKNSVNTQAIVRVAEQTTLVEPAISQGLFSVYEHPIKIELNNLLDQQSIVFFNQPVSLAVEYDQGAVKNFAEDQMQIAYFDDQQNKWIALPTTTDTNQNTSYTFIYKTGSYKLFGTLPNWLNSNIKSDVVYREQTGQRIYYVKDGIKNYIDNYAILNSWGWQISHIVVTRDLSHLLLGMDLKYRDGSLIKIGTNYYYIEKGTKRMLNSETVIADLGWNKDWAYIAGKNELDNYPDGRAIFDAEERPDYSLIKYTNSPKVYLLESKKKRWITDENAFRKNRFSWAKIVTVSITEIYPDGEPLK